MTSKQQTPHTQFGITKSTKTLIIIATISVTLTLILFINTTVSSHNNVSQTQSKENIIKLTRTEIPTNLSNTYKQACEQLFRYPQPLVRCHRDLQEGWQQPACDNGTMSFHSQFSQDYYLYMHHFQFLQRPGVYLDVAANEPIHISNTWVFDACLNWRGLCVEANPQYISKLRQARTCHLIPTCVGDVDDQTVTFILGKGMSGIEDTNKNLHRVNDSDRISLNCSTLRTQLRNIDVDRVDYFSLDVEGHEMYVLRGIDWQKLSFNVITVEVTMESSNEIESFLTAKGYVRHFPSTLQRKGLLHMDAVFLHPSVTFGQPV